MDVRDDSDLRGRLMAIEDKLRELDSILEEVDADIEDHETRLVALESADNADSA